MARSPVSGKGLFATKQFRRGDTVCQYTGRLWRRGEEPYNRYLVELDDDWTLDGSSMSNLGRWINHSCAPNALLIARRKSAFVRAKRKIRPGEEVTVDYGEEYREMYLKECHCPKCNGHAKGSTRCGDGFGS